MNTYLNEVSEKLNPFIWNYYMRRSDAYDKYFPWRCRAVKFEGKNLEVITKPTGIIAALDFGEKGGGVLRFKRTRSSPSQTLRVGEYLTWDGTRFTTIASDSFHKIYRPRCRQ